MVGTDEYISHIEHKITQQQKSQSLQESKKMQENLQNLIDLAYANTMAMAHSLSIYPNIQDFFTKNSNNQTLHEMIKKLQQSPQFQHITIAFQNNLTKVEKSQSYPTFDHSTIQFHSIIPIKDHNQSFLGSIIATQSFDSLGDKLNKMGISSILLLDKMSKKHITQAINHYSFNDYTLYPLNSSKTTIAMIKHKKLHYFLNGFHYSIYHKHLITTLKMKNTLGNEQGYYLLIKPMQKEGYSTSRLLFILKILILVLFLIALLFLLRFFQTKHSIDSQTDYFKEVINATMDIIIVANEENIVDVNQAFFNFFDEYNNLEEFSQDYDSISNFFEEEEGYIHKQMGIYSWVEYIYFHKKNEHHVKILYKGKTHIFTIKVQALERRYPEINKEQLYSVVLTDMTAIREYQKKLEGLSKTDMLTQVGNRAFFDQQLDMEVARAQRYGSELSIIMFEIGNMKKINKLYDEETANNVLLEVVHETQRILRATDVFCRYKESKFMIILPKVTQSGATVLANRLTNAFEQLHIRHVGEVITHIAITECYEGDWGERMVQRVERVLQQSQIDQNTITSI